VINWEGSLHKAVLECNVCYQFVSIWCNVQCRWQISLVYGTCCEEMLQLLVTANVVPSSLILVILMMEAFKCTFQTICRKVVWFRLDDGYVAKN
jgi:hypothetical protein